MPPIQTSSFENRFFVAIHSIETQDKIKAWIVIKSKDCTLMLLGWLCSNAVF